MQLRCTYNLKLLLACCIAATQPANTRADEAPAPAPAKQTKITISKETTRVLGPLDDQGYVDYAAALDEITSQGVTPENNANVLYWQAIGPEPLEPAVREVFFEKLGIGPLPEQDAYFLPTYEAQKVLTADEPTGGADSLRKQLDIAVKRPWTKKEFPLLARWIEHNSKPLELVVAGTKRPQYYSPIVRSSTDRSSLESTLVMMLLPGVDMSREFAQALAARAMLQLQSGRTSAAWQDLLACHRLARHVGQGPLLVEVLVCFSIDRMASDADAALVHHANLSREQLQQLSAQFLDLPPLPSVATKIEYGERFVTLDAIDSLVRSRMQNLDGMIGLITSLSGGSVDDSQDVKQHPIMSEQTAQRVDLLIDWNEVLRRVNKRFDRLVAAAEEKDTSERLARVAEVSAELTKLGVEGKRAPSATEVLLQPKTTATNKIDISATLLLMSALPPAATVEVRGDATLCAIQLAFSVAAYRADHGHYPAAVTDLTPKYLAKRPKDPFNGQPLRYKAEGDTAILYSVGPNLRDDRGDDSHTDTGGDDVVLRLPPKLEKN